MIQAPPPKMFQFPDGPQDTVSSLAWSNDGTLLAATAWNNEIKVWQLSGGATQNAVMSINDTAPQFSSAFLGNNILLTAGADNVIKRRDFQTKKEDVVGTHALPIRKISVLPQVSAIASGSWDQTVCLWDLTNPTTPRLKIQLPERVYALDSTGFFVAAGTADHDTYVFDIRNSAKPMFQLHPKGGDNIVSCCSLHPQGTHLVVGYVEGLVNFLALNQAQAQPVQKFDQRVTTNKVQHIHDIADCDANPQGYVAMGGGGKYYDIWNFATMEPVGQNMQLKEAVTAVKFAPNGIHLASSCGFNWEFGPPDATRPRQAAVCVQELQQSDFAPRPARR